MLCDVLVFVVCCRLIAVCSLRVRCCALLGDD